MLPLNRQFGRYVLIFLELAELLINYYYYTKLMKNKHKLVNINNNNQNQAEIITL